MDAPVMVDIEKFIHTLPWMTRISSTGRPAFLKVKNRIRMTNSTDSTDTMILSVANDAARS